MLTLLAQAEAQPVGGPLITSVKWAMAAPCILAAVLLLVPAVLVASWLGLRVYKNWKEANK